MEDNEGVGGGGFGGDPSEQFHRNEAISAVVDEGFLGEEEDDDFEDLYNDVNVGENFLQSMKKTEDFGATSEVAAAESMPNTQTLPQPPVKGVPETGGVDGDRERTLEGDEGVSTVRSHPGRLSEGYQQQNTGFEGQGVGGGVAVDAPGGSGLRVELGQQPVKKGSDVIDDHITSKSVPSQGGVVNQHPPTHAPSGVNVSGPMGTVGNIRNFGNEGLMKQGGINVNGAASIASNGYGNVGAGGGAPVNEIGGGRGIGGVGGQGAMLFVGDLHWWTTDAELEAELSKYGQVKEVKFFDEKASGKSKGYCQVEFYDSAAASACKEGMNGHVFNGRPCLVAYASPFTIKKMGEAQVNRNQSVPQTATPAPGRRTTGDAPGRPGNSNIASGGNYQGSNYQGSNYQGAGDNRGYGRGNWGRGNGQGMGGRGPVGPMRNRPGMGGRGMMGNGGMGFGQGIGPAPPLLPPPQTMMGQGFDPAFGGPMGRMGAYGGFHGGPTPPFSGMMPSFPQVGGVGLPGVAPHVNPAFFGRGMPMSSMGMMPSPAIDGPNSGMWEGPNAGGWAGEEHGGRVGESSYGEEAVSDHQYGEVSHDRGPWTNSVKEKDRGSERDWSGSSDRKYRDDRDSGHDRDMVNDNEWSERGHRDERDVRDRDRSRERDRERSRDHERPRERDRDRERERDRDRQRDDRDHYADHHRHRERGQDYNDEWDRGRSSRTHSKSRMSHEEEQRARSRDSEYGKRRRLTSDN